MRICYILHKAPAYTTISCAQFINPSSTTVAINGTWYASFTDWIENNRKLLLMHLSSVSQRSESRACTERVLVVAGLQQVR